MISKNFPTELLENESIIEVAHKHWIIHLVSGIYGIFLILCGGIFIGLKPGMENILGNGLFWGSFSIFIIICSSLLFGFIVSNFLDILVITNRRIFFVKKIFPIFETLESVELSEISEIRSESVGILATLFIYGNLNIGYAGGTQNKKYKFVKNPTQLIHIIHQLKEEEKNFKKVA